MQKNTPGQITSPESPELPALASQLHELAAGLHKPGAWPAEQLKLCGDAGVFRWFLPQQWGGYAWDEPAIIQGYLKLSAACLTTTFIITQRMGACQRVAGSKNQAAQQRWLPGLITGEQFATVGISHLTTSHRHLREPVLKATEAAGGYTLNGFSPWVTGAPSADMIVTGATLPGGRELLLALPADSPGVQTPPPPQLVGLSASQTGKVECHNVFAPADCVLAGPIENVMQQGVGGKTGGLQTSTLAIGLAAAALSFLEEEATRREDLQPPAAALRHECTALQNDLLQLAHGNQPCNPQDLRTRANSLVLRSAQAALTAAKGAGYVEGHPAGRWCREALFFLVWSCPQPVLAANLCELAGIQ